MPIYDDKQSTRPTQGYEADPARKARLFHDYFRLLLRSWDVETKSPQNIVWGNQKRRQSFLVAPHNILKDAVCVWGNQKRRSAAQWLTQAGGGENGPTDIPSHSPGPNASHYEHFRERCGAHLVYNAFWNITNFCVHQMIMRDPMHISKVGSAYSAY